MQVTIVEWTRRPGVIMGGIFGLTNHVRDNVMIDQRKGKMSDNLETVPKAIATIIFIIRVTDRLQIIARHLH